MTTTPATTGRWRLSERSLVFLLAAVTMIGPFTIDTIFPGFAGIEREFDVDPVTVQQTISIYMVSFAVMSLLHGPLSDALGRRPVMIWGLLSFAATSAFCALAPSMTWLLVARGLQGLVAGAGMVVSRTVVRDVFTGEPAQRAIAHMSMIFGLAPAAAPIVGGWLLGWSSWRSVFWFLAGMGLVLVAAVVALLPETHPAENRTPVQPRALLGALTSAVRNPGVRRLLAVSSLNFAALFTYISAAPVIVLTHLGLGEQEFGWLFVPIVAAMITGSWLTGRLAGRFRPTHFISAGLAIAAAGAVVQLTLSSIGVHQLPWLLLAPVTTGLGIALVYPIVTLALLDLSPRHRGTLSSLQSFTNTSLNAVVAGAVVPLVSARMPSLTVTALGFSLAAWAAWAWHARRSRPVLRTPAHPESYEPTDRM
ncbi:MAG: Bcr/CflA family drug resistance efflux transporter [Actinomycetales bacterium]|nr:MAG: Bcr/CflA family drug resistance efflux transporter [Actinomycetales bacterium]